MEWKDQFIFGIKNFEIHASFFTPGIFCELSEDPLDHEHDPLDHEHGLILCMSIWHIF